LSLKIRRGNVGPTTIDATVTDTSGKVLGNLQRVIYRYKPVGLDTDLVDLVAPASGGTARTPTVILGLAGDWDSTVIVRRTGLDDVAATLRLNLAGISKAAATPVAPTAPSPASGSSASPTTVPPTSTTAPQPSSTVTSAGVPASTSAPTATIAVRPQAVPAPP